MVLLSPQNPVFAAYLIAAAIMVLKLMGQGWVTVIRMIGSDGGLLNPEDLRPGPANRNPRPEQLEANEGVERSRRIQRNDLENIPAFLAAGLLFVTVGPPLLLARILFIAFVARPPRPHMGLFDAAAPRSARRCSTPSARWW